MSRATDKKPANTRRRKQTERRHPSAGRRWTDKLQHPVGKDTEDISLGPLKICDQRKKVFVHGKDKHIAPLEYELLRILAAKQGRAVSNEELAEKLWRHRRTGDPEDIKKYIYRLRKSIEPDPCAPRWIQNVRGVGYRLNLDDDDNANQDPSSGA